MAVEPKLATAPGQGDKGEESKIEATTVIALLENDLAGGEPHTVTVFAVFKAQLRFGPD
ncbi:hypothetical protein OROGR_012120 [Orobanche gracilis]